jgi:hypothetical protein
VDPGPGGDRLIAAVQSTGLLTKAPLDERRQEYALIRESIRVAIPCSRPLFADPQAACPLRDRRAVRYT